MRSPFRQRRTVIRRGRSSLSIDGALRSRRGNAYVRALGSRRLGGTKVTGKVSVGSRGPEIGGYISRRGFHGGVSMSNSGSVRPSLRIKRKKIF